MIITDQTALERFCDSLKGKPFITVDTEFIREKTYYPRLCLIQIGDPDKNTVAVDVLADPPLDLRPVFRLLYDPDILKIFHAGRQDLEIFYTLGGKVAAPFFDTQIAAMVCGYGDSIGYERLVRDVTGEQINKAVQYTNWAVRPLSKAQIEYALADVSHLVDLYRHLEKELEKRDRVSWVYQEEEILADASTYENRPEDAWTRIKVRNPTRKTLAVLRALAAWREEKAQAKDVPRTWIMRDETLVNMASQTPDTLKKLGRIRNIPEKYAQGERGEKLLALIKDTLKTDKSGWPEIKKRRQMPPQASATYDILRMLLRIQSLENDVVPKLIADKNDLERLAIESEPDIAALRGWRREIFGEYALALKKGELAIGLDKKGQIARIDLSGADTKSVPPKKASAS